MVLRLIVILFLSGINMTILYGQFHCGTEELFGERPTHISFKSIYGIANLRSEEFEVPLKFHVIRNSDGVSAYDTTLVDSILTVLNSGFMNTPFSFYKCGDVHFIDDDRYVGFPFGGDHDAFFNFYNSKQAINVYLPERIIVNPFNPVSGFAFLPWRDIHAYVISQSNLRITHIHEMGHVLGLYHTHYPGELVDGSNCKIAGDLCCDTPAERSLSGKLDVDCRYTGNETDPEGTPYDPDVGNYMSYGASRCLSYFTDDQIDWMVYYYLTKMSYFRCDEDFEYTDLGIEDIETFPSPAIEGEPYELRVTLTNSGNTLSENVNYDVTLLDQPLTSFQQSIFHYTPFKTSVLSYEDDFPSAAGRYEICVETEGNELELNQLNNRLCKDIVIRKKEGIPDLNITSLKAVTPFAEKDTFNDIEINFENIGSLTASSARALVKVNGVVKDEFDLPDIESGKSLKVIRSIPFGIQFSYDICVEISPAFTEERVDNNVFCKEIGTTETLSSDLEIEYIELISSDSTLQLGRSYTLDYQWKNNGPGIAYEIKSTLWINDQVYTEYDFPFGFSTISSRIDSHDFVIDEAMDSILICVEMSTFRDIDSTNNQACIKMAVENPLSHTNEADNPQNNIAVYPNPVGEWINVLSEYPIHEVQIYNMMGQIVYKKSLLPQEQIQLDLKALKSGVYQVRTKTLKGQTINLIVKQ